MNIRGIIWLDEIVDKLIWKHHITTHEVRQVLQSKPIFRFMEKGHRQGENVYAAFGTTRHGRHVIVFFVLRKDNHAVIISARTMTRKEKKYYENS